MKAIFEHDCRSCQYLGSINEPSKDYACDYYICNVEPNSVNVICRYSDYGPDYQSTTYYLDEADLEQRKDLMVYVRFLRRRPEVSCWETMCRLFPDAHRILSQMAVWFHITPEKLQTLIDSAKAELAEEAEREFQAKLADPVYMANQDKRWAEMLARLESTEEGAE